MDSSLLGKWWAKLWEASKEREVWLDEDSEDVPPDEPKQGSLLEQGNFIAKVLTWLR